MAYPYFNFYNPYGPVIVSFVGYVWTLCYR